MFLSLAAKHFQHLSACLLPAADADADVDVDADTNTVTFCLIASGYAKALTMPCLALPCPSCR